MRPLTRLDEALEDLADRTPEVKLCGKAYPGDSSQVCLREVDATGTHPGIHESSPGDHTRGVGWRDDV